MALRFELHGPADAPALLLSAGLGGLGAYWRPQLPALAREFRVVLYDQRGTGANTQALAEPYAIADMAADVLGILDAAGIARAHVMGHALGGLVGIELALRAPARLRSLVVVNGWARLDSHTARCFAVRRELLRHGGPASYARAQPIFLYPAAWLSANPARVAAEEVHGVAAFQGEATLLARIAALSAFDVSARLGQVAAPSLLVSAADDVLVPCTCSDALAAGIPGAEHLRMPGGGHACNVTETAAFDAAVLAFLRRH